MELLTQVAVLLVTWGGGGGGGELLTVSLQVAMFLVETSILQLE